MKKILLLIPLGIILNVSYAQPQFNPGKPLTGDTALACEAILCLASATKPTACAASLSKYFSFSARKWRDVVTKRKNFLNLCPTGGNEDLYTSIGVDPNAQKAEMDSFVNSVVDIPHDCTIDTLNKQVSQKIASASDYSLYLDRDFENKDLTSYEKDRQKRRLLSSWNSRYRDYYRYNEKPIPPAVFQINSTIPSACNKFYVHSWSPERPTHNKNFNWYFKDEFATLPPPVWH